jgi:hypothetical protein
MSARLTLYIDNEVVQKAKAYVKTRRTSLSKMVNDYLKTLQTKEISESEQQAPLTRSLRGVLRDERLSEKTYHQYLEKKYL